MTWTDPLLFAGGAPRSGTTLVRNLLATHPVLALPHESEWVIETALALLRSRRIEDLELAWRFIQVAPSFRRWGLDLSSAEAALMADPPRSYRDLVGALYHQYAVSEGKSLAGDRTPRHARHFELLGDLFPGSRFVHILRDPREVSMSLVLQPFHRGGLAEAALTWTTLVGRARQAAGVLGDRWAEVRYERLVADPDTELASLLAFVGLDPVAAPPDLDAAGNLRSSPVHRARIETGLRRWAEELSNDDIATIEYIAGPLMQEVGYPPVATRTARARAARAWSGIYRRFYALAQPPTDWVPAPRRLPAATGFRRPWRPCTAPPQPGPNPALLQRGARSR